MAGPYGTPRTWSSGEVVTAAQLNAELRDWVSALANPPSCRVYHNTTQSLTDNTEATVTFNSERWDTDSMHESVTNPSRVTFNTAGLYVVTFCCQLAAGADYTMAYATLRLNGTTTIAQGINGTIADAGSAGPTLVLSTIYKFAAADYVEVRAYQNNAANTARNILANLNMSPELAAARIGIG